MSTVNVATLSLNLTNLLGQVSKRASTAANYFSKVSVETTEKIISHTASVPIKVESAIKEEYEKMLQEIGKADERIKWLDSVSFSSPTKLASEVRNITQSVVRNNTFKSITSNLHQDQKEILALLIASENSPMCNQISDVVNNIPASSLKINQILIQSTQNLASDFLCKIHKAVEEAAVFAGFTEGKKEMKINSDVFDIVFNGTNGRRLSSFCRLDNDLNPVLALDLEGFDPSTNECLKVMDKITAYLKLKGLNVEFKQKKHFQPHGLLRQRMKEVSRNEEIEKKRKEYLTNRSNQNSSKKSIRQK
jgi:hypothetical protein